MNYGPLVSVAAFLALAVSWLGFVLTPQIQIGREQAQTNIVNRAELYPQARPGLARQGLEVYRANGCAYCHSQQISQTATVCNVVLTDAGTNQAALVNALIQGGLGQSNPVQFLSGLPKSVLQGVDPDRAGSMLSALKTAGAKGAIQVAPVGPDIARDWGKRRTVAADYLYDSPVMLGSLRIGPDLANVAVRLPDPNWQLRHLYAPRSEVKNSSMPPYRFLFERRRIQWRSSPDALQLPKELSPPPGGEIVPKPEAKALAAYLLSLRANTPLFEAPLTAPSVSAATAAVNAPAK